MMSIPAPGQHQPRESGADQRDRQGIVTNASAEVRRELSAVVSRGFPQGINDGARRQLILEKIKGARDIIFGGANFPLDLVR
jgi:hypothetical protein